MGVAGKQDVKFFVLDSSYLHSLTKLPGGLTIVARYSAKGNLSVTEGGQISNFPINVGKVSFI